MKPFYVVTCSVQPVEAATARAAARIVAAQPRVGEGRDFVVRTEREAKALLLSMIGGQRGPKPKAKGARP